MIKTQTNPELLNDLRKLCKGVKEIDIRVSHWTAINQINLSLVRPRRICLIFIMMKIKNKAKSLLHMDTLTTTA